MSASKHSYEDKLAAVQMYKDGHTMQEVADVVGVHKVTISQWVRKYGNGYDRTHVGGRISRTMKEPPRFEHTEIPEFPLQAIASVAIIERTVVGEGLGTSIRYTVKSGAASVILTKDGASLEVPVDKLDDFILELQGVQKNLKAVKANNEVW